MKKHISLLCAVALLLSMLIPAVFALGTTVDTQKEVLADRAAKEAAYEAFLSVDSIFYEDSVAVDDVLSFETNSGERLFETINGDMYYRGDLVSGHVGNENVLFFAAGDTIYRYHIASGVTDTVLEDPDIIWYYPLSDYNILFATSSEGTSAFSKEAVQCSKEVPSGQVFSYNMLTECTEIAQNPVFDLCMTGMKTSYNILSSATMTINGKEIPHPNYPIGSVYSGSFEGGTQCHGFALYIYNYIWGSTSYGTRKGRTSLNKDENIAKAALKGISPGTLVRMDDTLSAKHAMIIESTSESGIRVYHANWTGGLVCETVLSYSDIATRWTEISYMQVPSCRYSKWVKYDSNRHVKTCLDCGKQEYQAHYAKTPGYGTCLGCGYVGYISNGLQDVPGELQ